MKAAQWIDQAKLLNGWQSDYRAAQALGISKATVSLYRARPHATLADDIAVKVAKAIGREPVFLIMDQVAERTKSDSAKAALFAFLSNMQISGDLPGDQLAFQL